MDYQPGITSSSLISTQASLRQAANQLNMTTAAMVSRPNLKPEDLAAYKAITDRLLDVIQTNLEAIYNSQSL